MIFTTMHGSHLYGLAHRTSDIDIWTVLLHSGDRKYSEQTMGNRSDATFFDMTRFLNAVSQGSPQAVEAIFSREALIHPSYRAFFRGLRPGIEAARSSYYRTILNFSLKFGNRSHQLMIEAMRERAGDDRSLNKLRIHGMRLISNLNDLNRYGQFDPRLTEHQAASLRELSGYYRQYDQRHYDPSSKVITPADASDNPYSRFILESLGLATLGRLDMDAFFDGAARER